MTTQLLAKEHINVVVRNYVEGMVFACLLYTSDAADE